MSPITLINNQVSLTQVKRNPLEEWIAFITPYGAEGDDIRKEEEARYLCRRPPGLDSIQESVLTSAVNEEVLQKWVEEARGISTHI